MWRIAADLWTIKEEYEGMLWAVEHQQFRKLRLNRKFLVIHKVQGKNVLKCRCLYWWILSNTKITHTKPLYILLTTEEEETLHSLLHEVSVTSIPKLDIFYIFLINTIFCIILPCSIINQKICFKLKTVKPACHS